MEDALQEIKESLKILPSHIREVITHTSWSQKIEEIALKYSLTEKQKSALFTETLLILLAINPEDDFIENIENEVGVSSILAEQLAEEVGERVFIWIQKLYTEKERKGAETTQKQYNSNTLDIPPPNLPGEILEDTTTEAAPEITQAPVLLRDEVKDFFAKPTLTSAPAPEKPFLPSNSLPVSPVQSFTPHTPPSFIAQKLTEPTKTASQPLDIPKTYTADPYREPIE